MKTDALAAGHTPPRPAPDGAHVAAKQLEAFFLRQLLAESRPQGGGMLDGGFAGDTFKQMLDEAIADKMTAAGGVGMTELFAKQLTKANEVSGVHAPPAGNANIAIARTGNIALGNAPAAPLLGVDPPLVFPGEPGGSAPGYGIPHFILPVAGRPSSGYGLRADPIHGGTVNHPGFDLAATTGTEVSAAARGTVVHAGPAGTYGNLVTLRHENGFETRYAHLSAIDVRVGDLVEAGQDLGKVGTTGYSTGPHLHFEVRQDGKPIDPAPLLPLHSSKARTTR